MTPMLHDGSRVRLRDDWPETRGPCHVRTPHYLRGREGVVRTCLGTVPDPERLAFREPAPLRPLYHVAFDRQAVWSDSSRGELVAEIYEHGLKSRP